MEEAITGSHNHTPPAFNTSAAREDRKTTQWFTKNFVSLLISRLTLRPQIIAL
jgi:hypothetical protein